MLTKYSCIGPVSHRNITFVQKNIRKKITFWNKYPTHWGQMIHIFVGKLTIIGSDNGLPSDWCQAIIWTNAGILLIGPLVTNFSGILIKIHTFSFKKNAFENVVWKMAAILSPPQCVYTSVLLLHYSQSKCSSISQLVGSLDTIRGKFHLYLMRTTTRLCWHCSLLLDCWDQCIQRTINNSEGSTYPMVWGK